MKKCFPIIYVAISLILLSCGSLKVEKRKYLKGYHIQYSKRTFANINHDKKVSKKAHKKQIVVHQPKLKIKERVKNSNESNLDLSYRTPIKKTSPDLVKNINSIASENIIARTPQESSVKTSVTSKESKSGDGLVGAFGALSALLIGGLFMAKRRTAKKISHWAKRHKWESRGLIAGSKLALGAGGYYVGNILHDMDYAISETTSNVLYASLGLTALMYPIKNSSRRLFSNSYMRRKTHDLSLTLCGLLLAMTVGNQAASDENLIPAATYMFDSVENSINLVALSENNLTQLEGISNFEVSKDNKEGEGGSTAGKILFTLLVIALFLFLELLVLSLSCSLSCNGQESLAAVVGIGGTFGLIVAFIYALNAIWKK
jgi:hypothetical protein